MFANMARLSQDMNTAKNTVSRAVGSINSALGSIGVGLSFAGIAFLVKGSIDALDRLHDLSTTTGISVEQLSGLSLVAKQSGGDIESLAKSVDFLSKNIGKAPAEFKALGISTKDPLKAFMQLSDIFNSIKDPQERAAVMAKALGKAWEGAAPALGEGSKRLEEMINKGMSLSGVTAENAAKADEFNDKMDELKTTFGGFITNAIGPMLPMLLDVAKYLQDSGEKARNAAPSFSILQTTFQAIAVVGANVAFTFNTMGEEAYGLYAKIERLAHLDLKGAHAIGDMIRADTADARKQLDAFEKSILHPTLPSATTAPATTSSGTLSASQLAALRGFTSGSTNNDAKHIAEQQAAFHKKEMEDQAALTLEIQKANQVEKTASQILQEKLNAYVGMDPALKAYNQGIIDSVKATEQAKKATDQLNEQVDIEHKATLAEAADAEKAFQEKVAMDVKLQKENEDLNVAIILNDKKRAKAQLELEHQRILDEIAMLQDSEEEKQRLVDMENENYKLRMKEMVTTGKDGFDELKRAVEGFGNKAADAFIDFAFKGKASFGDMISSILQDLAKLALKRNILDPLFAGLDTGSGGGLGDFFSSIFGGGKAAGGPVNPSQMYMVGERGPEMFVPNVAGHIVPSSGGSGGPVNITVMVDAKGTSVEGNSAQSQALGKLIGARIQEEIIKQQRPAGLLHR